MEAKAQKIILMVFSILGALTACSQRWERIPDFDLTRRMGAIAFSWNGKGYVGFGHDFNARYPFNDLTSYDPATGKWEEVTWLDSGFRTAAFCFLLGDELYTGGGTRDSGRTALRDFYRYNLRAKTWTKLAGLPFTKACGASAVAWQGMGWVLGGCTNGDCEARLWCYDSRRDVWDSTLLLPAKSMFGVAFVLNEALYFGLGNGVHNRTWPDFWKLGPGAAGWQRVRSFTEIGRSLACGVAIDPTHAVVGLGFRLEDYLAPPEVRYVPRRGQFKEERREPDYMMADFWLYDALKDKWKILRPHKRGRRGAVCFVVGNYLYVGMGNVENKTTKDVYRLDLTGIR